MHKTLLAAAVSMFVTYLISNSPLSADFSATDIAVAVAAGVKISDVEVVKDPAVEVVKGVVK